MKGRVVQLAARAVERARAAVHRRKPGESAAAPDHLISGRRGEDEAYFFLRSQGYTVVARNYRSRRRRGEIDLIAWDGDVLCFIEVKTRSTRDVKPAEAAVDREKRRDLLAIARDYRRRLPQLAVLRGDIVTVYCDNPRTPPQITLFKNAFPVS